MDLRNESGIELKATILRKADPGDSTVPMKSSAAGLDPHARLVCKHVPGYEHDASYGDERVRLSVLDAIVRSIESVQVIK
ncbi:hypothetical protein [[Pseudomonas] boreopolis]|uniref:hypothetical protein n=1 Tax=Xanthomonas boreopolis TaxID=86183 RepID=UPI003D49F6DD